MACKIRELKARLTKAGFQVRPGKGSHTVWRHPRNRQAKVTLSGRDKDDAQPYQIKEVEGAMAFLKENKGG